MSKWPAYSLKRRKWARDQLVKAAEMPQRWMSLRVCVRVCWIVCVCEFCVRVHTPTSTANVVRCVRVCDCAQSRIAR